MVQATLWFSRTCFSARMCCRRTCFFCGVAAPRPYPSSLHSRTYGTAKPRWSCRQASIARSCGRAVTRRPRTSKMVLVGIETRVMDRSLGLVAGFDFCQIRGLGLFAFHVPNGRLSDPHRGCDPQGMGVTAGVPDILAIHQGRVFGLELKADGGDAN